MVDKGSHRAPHFFVAVAALLGVVFVACGAVWLAHASTRQDEASTPVLVELFTSEGCSSCPPADELLIRLEEQQPVPGAQIIVVSEHVDYWNGLGWRDPFSSMEFTQRQEVFRRALGEPAKYTPQMVVDGHAALIGSLEVRGSPGDRAGGQAAQGGPEPSAQGTRGAGWRDGPSADCQPAPPAGRRNG